MPGIEAANNILATFGRVLETLDYDDPVYQRMLLRPPVITEDMRTMEQRKRVKIMLHSSDFRQELDTIIASQLGAISRPSACHPGLKLCLTGGSVFAGTANVSASTSTVNGQTSTVPMQLGLLPINDLRARFGYSEREAHQRCKLAALYRLIDMFDWASSIYNHISLRVTKDKDEYLINPFGLLYHEVTASSLVKVDGDGNVLDQGCTNLSFDDSGWKLHSFFHNVTQRVRCIIHFSLPSVVAISNSPNILLPLSREAIILGPIECLDLSLILDRGFTVQDVERDAAFDGDKTGEHAEAKREIHDLREHIEELLKGDGDEAIHVLFIKGSGMLAFGLTVEEAWFYATNAIYACESQLSLSAIDKEDLWLPDEEEREQIKRSYIAGTISPGSRPTSPLAPQYRQNDDWRVGEIEYEALMRHLDNAGFRTGHFYRSGVEQGLRPMSPSPYTMATAVMNNDIEIPPTLVGMGATHLDVAAKDDITDTNTQTTTPYWMASHQEYHRCTDVTGTKTRWVTEVELPAVAIRVAASPISTPKQLVEPQPNKFAPQGNNPKEFNEKQIKLREMYYNDENTIGPQSKLVEGLTYEELMRLCETGLAKYSEDGNSLILLAASSKAIIDKDFQLSHPWLGTVYGDDAIGNITGNPFEKMSDADIQSYRREIELKNNPEYARLMREQDEREKVIEVEVEKKPVPEKKAEEFATSLDSPSTSAVNTLKVETSGLDDTEGTATDTPAGDGKDKKKKRRFKIPSFTKKKK